MTFLPKLVAFFIRRIHGTLNTRSPLYIFFILFSQAGYKNNKIIGTGDYFDVLPNSQNLRYEKA